MASSCMLKLLPLLCLVVLAGLTVAFAAGPDYVDALRKSILFYESQRSGKLPPNQRAQWRGDSAMQDGKDKGIDLSGGYYDAGDNVKFGFPMAFTVTMLAWGAIEFESQLDSAKQLGYAKDAIKWGTDYFLKAHQEPNVLYGEVGEGNSDHACWMRPEDMTTPRPIYRIDQGQPGSDLAAETAAAMAASSIVFKKSNPQYANQLISHAKQLFDFANNYKGQYQNSITVAQAFYSSSGYNDELIWAAAWLYHATNDKTYLDYLNNFGDIGGARNYFSWDDKFAGAQTLVAKLVLEGKIGNEGKWQQYKQNAEGYICSCLQKGSSNIKKTPAGLLFWQPWNNLQYNTAASFILAAYADYLSKSKGAPALQCQSGSVQPSEIISLVRSQIDYILGQNPKSISYMVGYGNNYPTQVHHRGASIVSIKKDRTPVGCKDGFDKWFNKNAPDPNVLEGAVVGGPDENDGYKDARSNYNQAEPTTVTNGPLVGVLARMTQL